MEFINLKAQYQALKAAIDAQIEQVLAHGRYINGPEVKALEQALADYVGVDHAIVCSSGTMALQLVMMALDLGPGDEVITTPFSFFATVEAIVLQGAKPVYVDIDPVSFNLDPSLIESQINAHTKAILPVNLFGQCADYTQINKIAERHGLVVIEDAAQSFGATHKGKRACGLSTVGITSFFPSKPLGTYGDGGACFTNDDRLAERIRLLLSHGEKTRYNHEIVGLNARFDTIKAAILQVKLNAFDHELELREQVARSYHDLLPAEIKPPVIIDGNYSVYGQFSILSDQRDALAHYLKEQGIPTAVHYPKLMYQQPCFSQDEQSKWQCPCADKVSQRVLSLPFGPYMTKQEVHTVCRALKEATLTV